MSTHEVALSNTTPNPAKVLFTIIFNMGLMAYFVIWPVLEALIP